MCPDRGFEPWSEGPHSAPLPEPLPILAGSEDSNPPSRRSRAPGRPSARCPARRRHCRRRPPSARGHQPDPLRRAGAESARPPIRRARHANGADSAAATTAPNPPSAAKSLRRRSLPRRALSLRLERTANAETGARTLDRHPLVGDSPSEPRMRRSLLPGFALATLVAAVGCPRADARPAADLAAAAAAKPCVPARGLVVPLTIRRNLTNGSEVTEPLSGDGYRITRCDTAGTDDDQHDGPADRRHRRQDRAAPRGDGATQVDHRPDLRRPGPRLALPRRLSPRPGQAAGQRAPADTGARPVAIPSS